jgi:hypothetical protein
MGGFAPCESRPSLLWGGGGELTARRGRSGAWMGSAQSRGRGFPLHWVRPPANSAECAAAMHRWGGVKPPLRRAGQNGSTQGDALGYVAPIGRYSVLEPWGRMPNANSACLPACLPAWMGSAQNRGRGFPLHGVRPPANSAECAAAMHRWGG